ncbi:MAG: MFS transporter [Acidimicrobiales bacterium]
MRGGLRRGSSAYDVAVCMAGTVASGSPVFLVGTVAVQMRDSLHFGTGGLGAAVALYYLGAAASSVLFGHLVERVGGFLTMRAAAIGSAVTLLLTATVVQDLSDLLPVMVAAGVASAAMQPAANQVLARRVAGTRQGLAFGVKQSAVPLAALLAGVAVPALALTVGWRWAFAAGAALAVGTAAVIPRSTRTLAERRAERLARPPRAVRRGPLVMMAVAFGLGVGAASALAAFLVSSAVASGIDRGDAGLLAAFGAAAALVSRIVTGSRADRRGRMHFRVVAAMLFVGAVGYAALAVAVGSGVAWLYVPVVVVVFAAGWGWNGLFNFVLVQTHPDHPARATAITQTGGRIGGVVVPFVFGQVASQVSYSWAWAFCALLAAMAGVVMLLARYHLVAATLKLHAAPS